MSKHNCLIAQSGGPTAVINSSLSGAISKALSSKDVGEIYGAINGIQGVIDDNVISLTQLFEKDPKSLETLKTTPAMFLGSCRYKLNNDRKALSSIFDCFKKYDIRYFFYIGGNDSMDTVAKLSQYAKEISFPIFINGIPKTIDNDLFGTHHTPGFGSAAKFVATSILDIAHDAYIYPFPSITIVEVMGRNAGWLTASTALARNKYNVSPDLIYLPEVPFSSFQFLKDIRHIQKNKQNVIVAVSEGLKEHGEYLGSKSPESDSFGHVQLSGAARYLEQLVHTAFNCKVRSVELNVLQRSAMHIASQRDLQEAFEIGSEAVNAALKGETGKMMIFKQGTDASYNMIIDTIPVEEVANREKLIPREWINDQGNDVTSTLIDYILPLIEGELTLSYENGLPNYMDISHLCSLG